MNSDSTSGSPGMFLSTCNVLNVPAGTMDSIMDTTLNCTVSVMVSSYVNYSHQEKGSSPYLYLDLSTTLEEYVSVEDHSSPSSSGYLTVSSISR